MDTVVQQRVFIKLVTPLSPLAGRAFCSDLSETHDKQRISHDTRTDSFNAIQKR